jgi:hypothetical protein
MELFPWQLPISSWVFPENNLFLLIVGFDPPWNESKKLMKHKKRSLPVGRVVHLGRDPLRPLVPWFGAPWWGD